MWSQAVSSRDDSHPFEVGEALLLCQRRRFCGVQRAVRGEDAHAQPGEVPRGQADCACLQRRRDEGRRRNSQGQSRERAEEAALHGLERIVPCLDKASINFIRLHKPDGVEAWKAIVGKHSSTERSRMQTLLTQLAGLKMAPGEKVTDFLTRAEGIRLDFQEAGEMTSNAMFSAMVLKGLPLLQLSRASRRFSTSDHERATER